MIDKNSEQGKLPNGLDMSKLPPEVVKAITRPLKTMSTPERGHGLGAGRGHSSLPEMQY